MFFRAPSHSSSHSPLPLEPLQAVRAKQTCLFCFALFTQNGNKCDWKEQLEAILQNLVLCYSLTPVATLLNQLSSLDSGEGTKKQCQFYQGTVRIQYSYCIFFRYKGSTGEEQSWGIRFNLQFHYFKGTNKEIASVGILFLISPFVFFFLSESSRCICWNLS